MNIIRVIHDLFDNCFGSDSWNAWKVVLKATFGVPLSEIELERFRQITARNSVPSDVRELWMVVGRRGGKSRIAALVAVYVAFFMDWSSHLAPGEKGRVMVINPDRKQGQIIFGYITALIESVPMLHQVVERKNRDSIHLNNGIIIEITTCNFRTIRGYTVVAAICDEIAFWRSEESTNPDFEVLNALRPAMATIENALLVCISSPYWRKGMLWEAYRQHYGTENHEILVCQASTEVMNPTISHRVIEAAYAKDPAVAAAEYGAQFRQDLESFISEDVLWSCIIEDRFELPPNPEYKYVAAVDPSGGGPDEFTLSICHREEERIIQDVIRGLKSEKPADVVKEYSELLKQYRVTEVVGDRYSGEWVRQAFQNEGIEYRISDVTASEAFLELLPILDQGSIELLDDRKQTDQLLALERKKGTSGKDRISHPPGGHDDRAVALALSAVNNSPAVEHSEVEIRARPTVNWSTTRHQNPMYRMGKGGMPRE